MLLREAKPAVRKLAMFCQQLTGDAAYDRFVAHLRARHPTLPVPSRERFYRDQQERKWQGITRCC